MRVSVSHFITLCVIHLLVTHGNSSLLGNSSDDKNLGALTGKIVNGTRATLGQFPQQVSLRRVITGIHFCGGSVISKEWVVTAAHCMFVDSVQIQPWTIAVFGGTTQLNNVFNTAQASEVIKIIVHPKFNSATLRNDIALLRLKTPFTFNETLKALQLSPVPPQANTRCQVSGWGYPAEDYHVVKNDLMFVTLPLLSQETCRRLLIQVSTVPTGMICAGYLKGGKDACQGDSGGGMVCNGYLTGIVSGGYGCARPYLPGLYTSAYHYRMWIADSIQNYEGRPYPGYPPNSSGSALTYYRLSWILPLGLLVRMLM